LLTLWVTSLRDFLNALEITVNNKCTEILKKYNITLDTDVSFHKDKQKIIREFATCLEKEIYEQSKIKKKNLCKYMEKLHMKSNDIFVDLGHFGSIQTVAEEIGGFKLKGKYIHLYSQYMNKTSFLPLGFLSHFTGIVELVFTENKGTVVSYTEEGKPVLRKDDKYRREITKKILKGVLQGVKDLVNKQIDVAVEDCIKVLSRFLQHPTIEEAEFGNRKIFENGSSFANESIVWYDKERIKEGKLIECYGKSYWKSAFKVLIENDHEYKCLGKGLP
jgi:hypothetical protein